MCRSTASKSPCALATARMTTFDASCFELQAASRSCQPRERADMSRRTPPAARRQHGVGLVEVLVSMLVLSIGLLGLATLHMWTLRNEQSTLERSFAVVATHSIVDA